LAQVDEGIWTILNKYFRSAFVWIPLQVLVRFGQVFLGLPKTLSVPGGFLFPGGWLIGGLLLLNLLAAHAVRFRLSWKRSGVIILHIGVIIMMLGELVTGLFAVEARMTIEQGRASNFAERHNTCELAIIDVSDPQADDVIAIPGSLLRKS